jgi:hypothetical protein
VKQVTQIAARPDELQTIAAMLEEALAEFRGERPFNGFEKVKAAREYVRQLAERK